MKKMMTSIVSMLILLLLTTQGFSQKMTWTTQSEAARDLAMKGATHFMNAEFEHAYADFSEAVKLDPDFTVALVFMSNLARGESSKEYAQKALKSAANKTEGEKLFASLATEGSTAETRRDIIGKLHDMFPDGALLGTFYVNSRATPEERFAAAQEYIKKFPDQPSMYNTIAYYYMLDKKDLSMAKQNLEKYMSMYPEGCNPYDSMGEYYLNAGDTANAEKYYKMALEKYPFFNNSINALQKIEDAKKK
jgi:Tfp pilus assembly protein PilF